MLFEPGHFYIVLTGFSGFIFLLLYDLAALKKVNNRFALALLGYGVQVYAIILAALKVREIVAQRWTLYIGGPLTVMGACWLLYCLVLFPPIRRTYREAGGPVLTTDGPYALSRHPGVYGYTAFVLGLALISRSLLLLQAGILWSLANLGYVLIQDRYIFPLLLTGYNEYRRNTPMLIPTSYSIKRFWQTK